MLLFSLSGGSRLNLGVSVAIYGEMISGSCWELASRDGVGFYIDVCVYCFFGGGAALVSTLTETQGLNPPAVYLFRKSFPLESGSIWKPWDRVKQARQ